MASTQNIKSALFTLETEMVEGVLCEAVVVSKNDCESFGGWPVHSHEMVARGAPEWLLRATTLWVDRKVGRGKKQRVQRRFANPWVGQVKA